jgi:branched-chain amino acid transport system substrate-binding protein
MERRTKLLVGLTMLLMGGLWPVSTFAADTVKIGAIFPLSGGGAFYGEDAKRAVEVAMAELNGRISIKGREYKIEPIYYDDGGSPSEAVKGLRKLVAVDKVNIVIGPIGASQVNAVCTVNEEEKVLVLANSGDKTTTRKGNKLILRFQTIPYMVASSYGKEFMKRRIKTTCILHDLTDWGVDWAESFQKGYEAVGGKVFSREKVNARKETDFYPILTQFKRLNPEALLIVAWDEPSGLIAKQAKEIGFKGKLCFTEQLRGKGIGIAGVENMVGALQGGGSQLGLKNMPPGMTKYCQAFEKRFPNTPPHGSGLLIYDKLLTVCRAMEKAEDMTDVFKIRKVCGETIAKIPAAYGEYKGITPGGQAWGYETVILEIGKDGKPFLVGKVMITEELAREGEPKMD